MKRFLKSLCVIMTVCLVLGCVCGCGNDADNNTGNDNNETPSSSGTTVVSETKDGMPDTSNPNITDGFTVKFTPTAYATVDVKNYGKIKIALAGNEAPITVKNFIKLAESKFYDGLTFHRIMSGFVLQGGDPEGTGMGGSKENIKGEFMQNGVDNRLCHVRGAISMARNSIDLNSASSQFFIVHDDAAIRSLDGMYACFGYVVEGMSVVDKICADAKPTDDNGTIPKSEQPIMNSVTISYP